MAEESMPQGLKPLICAFSFAGMNPGLPSKAPTAMIFARLLN